MKTIFELDLPAADAPMIESHFYKWLDQSVTRRNTLTAAIGDYLKTLGFNLTHDKIAPGDYETMHHIFQHYSEMYTPIRGACRLHALLKPANDGFYLSGSGNNHAYKPTSILLEVLKNTGLVYDLLPEHYYFKLNKQGYLFIIYQQILGSRRLAKIVTDSEAFNNE